MDEQLTIPMSDKYHKEALSFWNCGKIVQHSEHRCEDGQLLTSPITYLFRHSAELLLKALIIRDATNVYGYDITKVEFPPHNRLLSSMHSLQSLYDTWVQLVSYMLINPVDKDLDERICTMIQRVDACDPFSTFFRYPYDKQGNENTKNFIEPIDEDKLSYLPCGIGAILYHEGIENFSCWHGDDKMAWLEIDLDILISELNFLYTGKKTSPLF